MVIAVIFVSFLVGLVGGPTLVDRVAANLLQGAEQAREQVVDEKAVSHNGIKTDGSGERISARQPGE